MGIRAFINLNELQSPFVNVLGFSYACVMLHLYLHLFFLFVKLVMMNGYILCPEGPMVVLGTPLSCILI